MTKPTKWLCAQRRLGSAWASAQSNQSSLSTWRNIGSLATHWAHSEDWSDAKADLSLRWAQPSEAILLVLSWGGSYKTSFLTLTLSIDKQSKSTSAYKIGDMSIHSQNIEYFNQESHNFIQKTIGGVACTRYPLSIHLGGDGRTDTRTV